MGRGKGENRRKERTKKEEIQWVRDGKKRQHDSLVGVSRWFRGTEAGYLQSQRHQDTRTGYAMEDPGAWHGRARLTSPVLLACTCQTATVEAPSSGARSACFGLHC